MKVFGTTQKPSLGSIGKYDTGKTASVPAMKGGKKDATKSVKMTSNRRQKY